MATAPTAINESKPRNFEPRTIQFPKDVQDEIGTWLDKQIESRKIRLRTLHESEIPELRRIVDGKPREKNKSFPFPNCSNLIVQLAGEAVDDLAARVLQLIFLTSPIIYYRYLQAAKDDKEAANLAKKGKTLETFIDHMAYDPRELDLYPHENKWFTDSAGLGKARICVAPERREEAVYIGYENGKSNFEDATLYEGPKLINLRYEDILDDPDIEMFEENDPLIRVCTLNKRKLQERSYKGHFLPEQVKEILGDPDRYGPSEVKKRENSKKGISESTSDTTLAEWVIYECYFSWWHNKKKHRLIAWRHLKSKRTLNCVYNFIPHNQVPIIETSLSVDKKGFAEMLRDSQDEASTATNQRNDAITWGILGINTWNPQNKNIDRNFKLWPGITLPAGKDEFNHHEVANPAMHAISLQNEQAIIQRARDRAGVGPAVAGAGAGQVSKKGQYGSMGTLAVMQDSNTRASHRQSDFRHSHVKLLAMCTDFYGFMGLGTKGEMFGIDEKFLNEALEDFLDRRVKIPMRAATASVNKEVTKQNEILLNQAVSAYIKETSQQFQAIMDPKTPPEYKRWMSKIVQAKTRLMQQIVKDFQLSDQPEEYVPNVILPTEEPPNAQASQDQPAGRPGIPALAAILQARRGNRSVPQLGGGGPAGGPQGQV